MPTDEQFSVWCRRIKASDREAFRSVFEVLHDPLARFALRITGRTDVAQDVVQYAFAALWDMRADLDAQDSLEALLYRIVRNRAYNSERDRRSHDEKKEQLQYDASPTTVNPAAQMDADELEKGLRARIDDLPDRQREALTLSRFQGLSHDDIAKVMDISPRTVNNHIVTALKKLRRWVRSRNADHLQS